MSRLNKLRQSPERFFAESGRTWVRAAGRVVVPRLESSDTAMSVFDEPLRGLAGAGVPIASALARLEEARRARRRREVLVRAGLPSVSVVIAARNAAATIGRSIESLVHQSYPVDEVVVVDDASSDGTRELVAEIAAQHTQVRQIGVRARHGAARARNLGISHASGSYLTFQDADDYSDPERIERQLAALLERQALVCICNGVREVDGGKRIRINGKRYARSVISMLFPRESVLSVVGYMRGLRVGEDGEYFERIVAVFGRTRCVHVDAVLYRAGFSSESLLFSNGHVDVSGNRVDFVQSDEDRNVFTEALAEVERVRVGGRSPFVGPDGEFGSA